MEIRIYNKLVRDNIPDIIRESGECPVTRILLPEEGRAALLQKLGEECEEVLEAAASNSKKLLEECADVLEILFALAAYEGASEAELLNARMEKRMKHGGFEKRIYLEKVTGTDQ